MTNIIVEICDALKYEWRVLKSYPESILLAVLWSAGKITTQQYTDLLLQIIEQQEAKQ